jgi:hypothetical protein
MTNRGMFPIVSKNPSSLVTEGAYKDGHPVYKRVGEV